MRKKRNDGKFKFHEKKTRRTRNKGTTALIRSTKHKDAYERREEELKKRRKTRWKPS